MFLILIVTAILMIASPLARSIAIGPTRLVPLVHVVSGALLVLAAVLPFLSGLLRAVLASPGVDRVRIGAALREIGAVSRRALQGRSLARFNWGQRANIAFTLGSLGLFAITGGLIWLGRVVPYWIQEPMYELHVLLAIVSVVVLLAHIAMALTHPMAMRGMIDGAVGRQWANRHHRRWVELADPTPPRSTPR